MPRSSSPSRRPSRAESAALALLWLCCSSLAAVGILGAFAPRVPLGPMLVNVSDEYARLSQAFWHDDLPSRLGIWIDLPDSYLTFVTLISVPILANALLNLAVRKDYRAIGISWPITSSLCIVFFSFAFAMMSIAWIGTLGMSLYSFATLLLVTLVVLLTAAAAGIALPLSKWRRLHISSESEINIVIVALVLFMGAVLAGTLQLGGGEPAMDMNRMMLFGATLLGIYLTFKLRLEAPVYVMVSFFGLIAAGWTVDFAVPAIRQLALEAPAL